MNFLSYSKEWDNLLAGIDGFHSRISELETALREIERTVLYLSDSTESVVWGYIVRIAREALKEEKK
jgi:hypothetical protein